MAYSVQKKKHWYWLKNNNSMSFIKLFIRMQNKGVGWLPQVLIF